MRVISDMVLRADITIDADKLKEQPVLPEILDIIRVIRPKWEPNKISYKHFTGGISNVLYGYFEDGKFEEDVVLFRIDGHGTELMINRKREQEYMKVLHEAGCCAPLYAVYNNGLAYGYIQGEPIKEHEATDVTIRRLIAKELCLLHSVQPEGQALVPEIWEVLETLLELSPDGFPENQTNHERYQRLIKPKHVLQREYKELKAHLEALHSPIVFCHNDLAVQNIIYNKEKGRAHFIDFEYATHNYEHFDIGCHFVEYTGQVHFIDFEYATYNYEHFDIGCHFTKYTGIDDIDFTRYPKKAYQLDWIQYYLECKAEINGLSTADVTAMDVEDFYIKSNKFALLFYFNSGLWALVQARFSKLEFDFLEFASLKLGEYFARKDEFFSLQVPQ